MIAQYHHEHPHVSLQALCQALDVSRSWFYAGAKASAPSQEGVRLRESIERIALEFPGYGYRRVTKQLQREGWTINHKKVLRLMRDECLLCQLQKRFVVTTDSPHALKRYPNLLKAAVITALNQAWVADIPSIHLSAGFCYLAAVLDAFSRKVVGWQLSKRIDTTLALSALEQALETRRPGVGLIHHSDQGGQYASALYGERLEQAGALISMASKGNPYENAQAERFFKTLKQEEVYLKQYQSFEEAFVNIETFIEAVYNAKRLHSALGYLPPEEFEQQFKVEQGRTESSLPVPTAQELTCSSVR